MTSKSDSRAGRAGIRFKNRVRLSQISTNGKLVKQLAVSTSMFAPSLIENQASRISVSIPKLKVVPVDRCRGEGLGWKR